MKSPPATRGGRSAATARRYRRLLADVRPPVFRRPDVFRLLAVVRRLAVLRAVDRLRPLACARVPVLARVRDLLAADVRRPVERDALERDRLLLLPLLFPDGTFPPARRASDKPIAMACLRLVTFFPERPERNVPRFRSRIAFSTFSLAFLPYLAI